MNPLDDALEQLRSALHGLSSTEDPADIAEVDRAYRAAISTALAARGDTRGTRIDCGDLIGTNVVRIRTTAGWSQRELAEALTAAGAPNWSQQKIAQVETTDSGHSRRLKTDDLFTLAALFGVPVVDLLWPGGLGSVGIQTSDYEASLVGELLIGRGGKRGDGGPRWAAAAAVARSAHRRPATDYWTNKNDQGPGR